MLIALTLISIEGIKKAALTILNHLVKWPLSYIKQNGIIPYRLDAAHKLFNQIDRYITNWVGYCHPSSIFLWSRSPVSAEDSLWMMSAQRNEIPESPAWSSEYHLTSAALLATSEMKEMLIYFCASSARRGKWGSLQIKKRKGTQAWRVGSGLFIFTADTYWKWVSRFNTRVYCRFMCVLADEKGCGDEFLCLNVTWT